MSYWNICEACILLVILGNQLEDCMFLHDTYTNTIPTRTEFCELIPSWWVCCRNTHTHSLWLVIQLLSSPWICKFSEYEVPVYRKSHVNVQSAITSHPVGMLYPKSANGTVVPISFTKTTNSHQSVTYIMTPFSTHVQLWQKLCLFSARQCKSSHRNQLYALFRDIFGDRIISKELWPACCPHLTSAFLFVNCILLGCAMLYCTVLFCQFFLFACFSVYVISTYSY